MRTVIGFYSALVFILVRRLKLVEPVWKSSSVYIQRVVTIALLFSLVRGLEASRAHIYRRLSSRGSCVLVITARIL
ncbi:uncharacterized protein MICPUCDRAFT_54947 [Micromonas pusilla CCMP1545]|uniref:Predicted protein n=1 Tax=Micromonas pusilla (strain CCMP1545) TaxID=564608 RepID=C1NAK1_MICPC|nr:uncharacterized protein MICPUCDRAFT_54947 [Micromonas pusilla CCMP1545]EEH50955.1 predicted protein [Micromonas pusilla CCMP1545]|eukprot:XP_003064975.1 predicted protein [Micromonas pusilla CCMP1545]